MEIILKQDVANLGEANDLVDVKMGYARNYLIPKGFAILATKTAKKIHAETIKQRSAKEERAKTEALEIAELLKNKQIKIGAKTSESGKIFGSVNNIQLADAINKKGFNIERKRITILNEDHIKQVGEYKAIIKLHREVKIELPFTVFSE